MKVEQAKSGGEVIGWRVTEDEDTVLCWKDQKLMVGLRHGTHFIPGIGEKIEYEVILDTSPSEEWR